MSYNFRNCKACGAPDGTLKYYLKRAQVYICGACGFHYTDYLDPLEDLQSEVNCAALTREKRNYIETQLQSNVERVAHKIRLVREHVDPRGKKVLDIGCGGGRFLAGLREAGAIVFGIELDDARVQYAREVYGMDVVKYPIEHNYWQANQRRSFDIVTLWDVIEHVNFPVETLKAATRMLRPGGVLLLDTPMRDAFYHRAGALTYRLSAGTLPTFLDVMYANRPFGHKQIIGSQEMIRFFEEAGLKPEALRRIHELTFPYRFYLRKLVRFNLLVEAAYPFVVGFFKVFKIHNKMIVVGTRLAQ